MHFLLFTTESIRYLLVSKNRTKLLEINFRKGFRKVLQLTGKTGLFINNVLGIGLKVDQEFLGRIKWKKVLSEEPLMFAYSVVSGKVGLLTQGQQAPTITNNPHDLKANKNSFVSYYNIVLPSKE